jgi:hypothetical protein
MWTNAAGGVAEVLVAACNYLLCANNVHNTAAANSAGGVTEHATAYTRNLHDQSNNNCMAYGDEASPIH